MIDIRHVINQYPPHLQRKEFYENMIKEHIHYQMLNCIFSHKLSEKICFLGGTALRYFYNIPRFSEDLDFDCLDLNRNEFNDLTNHVQNYLQKRGYDVVIEDKDRYKNLKSFRRVYVFPQLKYNLGLSAHRDEKLFIKIEAESQNYKYKHDILHLSGFGVYSPVRVVPLGVIFSTKISAALKRKKDRDFFDIIHLLSIRAKPDFQYLKQKLNIKTPEQLKDGLLQAALEKKLDERKVFDCEHMLFNKSDIERVKQFYINIKEYNF